MPELPEVESVRRSLKDTLPKHVIDEVIINRDKTVEGLSPEEFKAILKGQQFIEIGRRAKYLIFRLSQCTLIGHLRMSGIFSYIDSEQPIPKHTHLIFRLNNGKDLRFKDLRAFGRVSYYRDYNEALEDSGINALAHEPLDKEFTLDYFTTGLAKYKSTLKPLLLDQNKVVSGLGNIYVDESLFCSGLHPQTTSDTLTPSQAKKLYKEIKRIIKEAVENGGTTFRDYIDANGKKGQYAENLYVYGRKGQPCKVCTSEIEYIKVAQRGTHICPTCQPTVPVAAN